MDLNPASLVSGINFKGVLGNIVNIAGLFIIAALIGGMVYMYFRWKKGQKVGIYKEIRWWEEIAGQLVPTRSDNAKEIIIPGTNLKIFYVKEQNMWLPRFSRGVTSNIFYVALTKNKEIVNFTLKTIEECRAKADLAFDHTDMRWAAENLREFVKRNYKDKSTTWWKEFSQIISIAIFIVIMTISFVTILYFLKGVVNDIGSIASSIANTAEKLNACAPGSGVVLSS